jgi:ribosomal protein S16
VTNEEMLRMLIPKEKFRYRMKKGATFSDAEANTLKKIEQRKEEWAMYRHLRILETFQ